MAQVAGGGLELKVAVRVVSAFKVTAQAPAPEQPPPDQPVKVEPELADATKVRAVPAL